MEKENVDHSVYTMSFSMDVTPEMIERSLEFMDSDNVKRSLDQFVQQEWFDYAAVAKKILDKRNQL